MITVDYLKRVPMFTVVKGGKNVANAKDFEFANTYWVLSPVIDDPPEQDMRDRVGVEGQRLLVTGDNEPVEPRIVDDNLLEDGLGHMVTDWDAILWALNDGFSLIKVPDRDGEPHYRWLVLANEPV